MFDDDDEVQGEIHDVIRRAGGKIMWLGDTEAGSKS
jgi:hypothetical protein